METTERSNANLVTWKNDDSSSREAAFATYSESSESYGNINKTQANRSFIGVQPNVSVRSSFNRSDYSGYRPSENIPTVYRESLRMCMDAYNKVGIIRNVIDLMGDFGSQGISIVHEDKSVEKFYKQWFKKISGKERSERFLNTLYKCGNVIIYRSSASITPAVKQYIRSMASDIKVEVPKFDESTIPWRYNFFNPLSVEVRDGVMSMFAGKRSHSLNISPFVDKFKNAEIPQQYSETLPPEVKKAIEQGGRTVALDSSKMCIFHYKKDDWDQWANPMIYAILDDIIMLEKMRLADLSALDGAISNVRLWTVGNFEYRVLPTKAGINRVRDALANISNGGTMELVWGPELTYTESNSQVYKFLGSEKYSSVLNSIYAGLGVPPTLTGMAGQSGGFTNNFISLKTLVERLQYGRSLLNTFWEQEIEIVRRAMGFRKPAHITFDQMSLADDSSEKSLLLQLADRDIISHETVLERFKEMPGIEKIRLQRERKMREEGKSPEKASPYHNPQTEHELQKIALQSGKVKPTDVGIDTTVPDKLLLPSDPNKPTGPMGQTKKKGNPSGGRPKQATDQSKRKKRVDTPRKKPGVAETVVWLQDAFDNISLITNNAFLHNCGKKNLRQLTKAQNSELENIKIDILCACPLMAKVDDSLVINLLRSGVSYSSEFNNLLNDRDISIEKMSVGDYKKCMLGCYLEFIFEENS